MPFLFFWELILLRTNPAVSLFFFSLTLLHPYCSSHLPCCALYFRLRRTPYAAALPAVLLFSSHLLPCCAVFIFFAHLFRCARILLCTHPAVTLFFFTLTLLYPYFSAHLPFCALTLLCPHFRLPCRAIIVHSALRLPCCALIFA